MPVILILLALLFGLATPAHGTSFTCGPDVNCGSSSAWPPTGTPADLLDGDDVGAGLAADPTACATGYVSDIAQDGTLTCTNLRVLLEQHEVVDVDPAEVGSVSCGLQEALARCNGGAGRCILQVRPDQTCNMPARSTWGDACAFETNGADDVLIRGYGAGSVINLTDNTGANTTHQLCIEAGSNNIVVTNLKLTRTDTCGSSCNPGGSSQISIDASASGVWIDQNVLYATESATSDATVTGIRNVHTFGDTTATPDVIPRRIWITNNDVQVSARGVEFQWCDHCWASDNYFNFNGAPTTDTTSPATLAAFVKYEGIGVVMQGNIINMRRPGVAEANFAFGQRCFWLIADFNDSTAAGINRSAQILGNTCEGMRTPSMYGVQVSGYNEAIISGNAFFAGQCSASATRECYVDEDCADLTGTCNTSTANGIFFDADATDSNGRNRGNLISSNIFDGFQESGTAACPFNVETVSGTDPTENTSNLITSNVLRLNNTTDDGFCGDASRIAGNAFSNNYVVGGVIPPVATPEPINTFYAGPSSGSDASPAFRAITDADLVGRTVSTATVATALANNPGDCAAGVFATAIAADGTLTCNTVATILQGAAPTADDPGDIAHDTTANQLIVDDMVLGSPTRPLCATIPDLTQADDNYEFWMPAPFGVTITSVGCRCRGTCTTLALFTLEDRGGNAMTITGTNPTCATTGTTTFAAVTAGNALVAGEGVAFDVTNAVAPETDEYTVCVTYTETRQ